MRWYSVLVPSIRLAEIANTAAGSWCRAGAAAMTAAPTTHETAKATACRTPRSRGRCPKTASAPAPVTRSRSCPSSRRRRPAKRTATSAPTAQRQAVCESQSRRPGIVPDQLVILHILGAALTTVPVRPRRWLPNRGHRLRPPAAVPLSRVRPSAGRSRGDGAGRSPPGFRFASRRGSRPPLAAPGTRRALLNARPSGQTSPLERLPQLASNENAHRAAAELDHELIVAVPEAAFELIRPDDKPGLSRTDVKEQRLDRRIVGAKQYLLQTLIELAAVKPPRDDARDERRPVDAREQHEHRPPDQAEQRLKRLFIAELRRPRALSAAAKSHHGSDAEPSGSGAGTGGSAAGCSAARASFFACFRSRFSRFACSRARLSTDCGDRRANSHAHRPTQTAAPARARLSQHPLWVPARPPESEQRLDASLSYQSFQNTRPPYALLLHRSACGSTRLPHAAPMIRRRRPPAPRGLSRPRPPQTEPARPRRAT